MTALTNAPPKQALKIQPKQSRSVPEKSCRWSKGSVAERLNAPVLKTGDGRPSVSSNLTASANYLPATAHSHLHCNGHDR